MALVVAIQVPSNSVLRNSGVCDINHKDIPLSGDQEICKELQGLSCHLEDYSVYFPRQIRTGLLKQTQLNIYIDTSILQVYHTTRISLQVGADFIADIQDGICNRDFETSLLASAALLIKSGIIFFLLFW